MIETSVQPHHSRDIHPQDTKVGAKDDCKADQGEKCCQWQWAWPYADEPFVGHPTQQCSECSGENGPYEGTGDGGAIQTKKQVDTPVVGGCVGGYGAWAVKRRPTRLQCCCTSTDVWDKQYQ